jgi:hypothetical protein
MAEPLSSGVLCGMGCLKYVSGIADSRKSRLQVHPAQQGVVARVGAQRIVGGINVVSASLFRQVHQPR